MNKAFCGFLYQDNDGNTKSISVAKADELIANFINIDDNSSKLRFVFQNINSMVIDKLKISVVLCDLQKLYPDKLHSVININGNELNDILNGNGFESKMVNRFSKEHIRKTYLKTYILEKNHIICNDIINNIELSTGNQQLWDLTNKEKGSSISKDEVCHLDSNNKTIANVLLKN